MRFLTALTILLFLFSITHAVDCVTDATSIVLSEQGTLVTAVIVLTMLIIIIAYLVGTVTGNVNFIVFAKDEAWHFGFSIVLLVMFSTLLLLSCSAVDFFYQTTLEELETTNCYSSSAEMSDVSICYLEMAKRDAEKMAENSIDKYIDKLMSSTFTFTLSIPLFNSVTSAAGAWRRVDANQYDTVLNMFIFPSLISLNMQGLFLRFISSTVVYWLLPAAFVFRIFIPTRQMGNLLIALAIGLYIIVPFIYTFNLAMYDVVGDDECSYYYAQGIIDDAVFGGCGRTGNFWDVARLLPQAFFLPNLAIALLITFLVGVNKALRVIG